MAYPLTVWKLKVNHLFIDLNLYFFVLTFRLHKAPKCAVLQCKPLMLDICKAMRCQRPDRWQSFASTPDVGLFRLPRIEEAGTVWNVTTATPCLGPDESSLPSQTNFYIRLILILFTPRPCLFRPVFSNKISYACLISAC